MRAVWFGLVASVLALGGAQAAECRAGHMALKAGAKTFSVAKASYSSREGGEVSSERVVLVGRIKRAPYVVDIQAVQGESLPEA